MTFLNVREDENNLGLRDGNKSITENDLQGLKKYAK